MNFKQQAENFIKTAQTRRRNPIKATTLRGYEGLLENHILPVLGSLDLAEVNNAALKTLVTALSEKGLATGSIVGTVVLAKLVVSSAVDDQGEELYPRKWNNDFIDLPSYNSGVDRKAPRIGADAISQAVSRTKGQYKVLAVLLAGTGLRIGEALALTSQDWDRANMTLSVTKTTVGVSVQDVPKTAWGVRVVDLSPELNAFMIANLGDVQGLLFKASNGSVLNDDVARRRLIAAGIPGAHSLRRFRATYLNRMNCPSGLERYWIGHSMGGNHERYIGFGNEIETRKNEARRIGLGFSL